MAKDHEQQQDQHGAAKGDHYPEAPKENPETEPTPKDAKPKASDELAELRARAEAAEAAAARQAALLESIGVDPSAEAPPVGSRRLVAEVRRRNEWVAVGTVPDNQDSIDKWHERFFRGEREGRIRALAKGEKMPAMQPLPKAVANVVGDVPGAAKGAF